MGGVHFALLLQLTPRQRLRSGGCLGGGATSSVAGPRLTRFASRSAWRTGVIVSWLRSTWTSGSRSRVRWGIGMLNLCLNDPFRVRLAIGALIATHRLGRVQHLTIGLIGTSACCGCTHRRKTMSAKILLHRLTSGGGLLPAGCRCLPQLLWRPLRLLVIIAHNFRFDGAL